MISWKCPTVQRSGRTKIVLIWRLKQLGRVKICSNMFGRTAALHLGAHAYVPKFIRSNLPISKYKENIWEQNYCIQKLTMKLCDEK